MFAHIRDENPGTILVSLQLVQILLGGGTQATCAWGVELNSYATCADEVQLIAICYATCVDDGWHH